MGLCTTSGTACIAATDADCAGSAICASDGRCTARGDGCVVGSDADCGRSRECRENGGCSARGGRCVPVTDAHCRQSLACQQRGLCGVLEGLCWARTDGDCAHADVCVRGAHCVAREGQCVERRLLPPQPRYADDAVDPDRMVAFEVLPLLSASFAGSSGQASVFGEAMVGLRWFEPVGLNVGLGYGGLGAEDDVFLVSLTPYFRPLPQDFLVDIVLGMPLGYVNFSRHRVVAAEGLISREIVRSDGIQVGAFLAAMAQMGDAFALGPVLQYGHFFAEVGEDLLVLGLGGRYAYWFER